MDDPQSLWSQTIALSLQFRENLAESAAESGNWKAPPTNLAAPSCSPFRSQDTRPQAVRAVPLSDTRSSMSLMQVPCPLPSSRQRRILETELHHKWLCSAQSKLSRVQRNLGSHFTIISCFGVSTAFLGHIHPSPEDASAPRLTGTNSHGAKGATGHATNGNFTFSFPGVCGRGLCWLHWKLCCKQGFYRTASCPGEKHLIF